MILSHSLILMIVIQIQTMTLLSQDTVWVFQLSKETEPLRSLTPENHTQTWLQLGSLSTKKASQSLKESVEHIFCDEMRRTSSATLVFNPYSDLK